MKDFRITQEEHPRLTKQWSKDLPTPKMMKVNLAQAVTLF